MRQLESNLRPSRLEFKECKERITTSWIESKGLPYLGVTWGKGVVPMSPRALLLASLIVTSGLPLGV